MENRPINKKITKRLMIVSVALVALTLPVLFYHLYKIQIRDAAELQSKAISQQTRDMLVSPVRGTIFDKNMIPLAVSATVETIVISPAEIADDDEARAIAGGLSKILNIEYDKILEMTKNKKSYYEVVSRKVDKEVADAVRLLKTGKMEGYESKKGYNGIKLFEDTKRYYPYSSLLSNVIGFTNFDNEGQYGLEMKYEDVLKGVVGRIITAKNNKGSSMPFYFEQYYDAQDGLGLVLTVDYGVQEILEKHLETALSENGCDEGVLGIVMDIKTGGILAMAQKGDFDLNNPRVITDKEKLEQIMAQPEEKRQALLLEAMMEQWRNKGIQEPYEPGSVFKLITAAIALEENVVNSHSSFGCSGTWHIGGTTGSCWKRGGHGSQTFAKALQNSCNSAFVNIALRIGNSTYYSYFKAFGLTEKTGIDMLGEVGVAEGIHYHKYSVFTNPKLGGDVSLGMYGFGQTFKITPIQMITAVSSLMNGGYLMQPYVVSGVADEKGNIVEKYAPKVVRQVISEQTSKQMRELAESVVSSGTGKNAYVAGYRVGGKTGTSEKRDKSIKYGRDFYIASFLGVAPSDDPQVAVLVLLDEPTGYLHQGGQIAAPVVGRIMADILPYLGVKPIYTDSELSNMSVVVPNAVGMATSRGRNVITSSGFKNVKIVGNGEVVTAQYPKYGSKIPASATVILYCGVEPDKSMVRVPNFIGKTFEEALSIANANGLYIDVAGAIKNSKSEFRVSKQTPAAGSGAEVKFGSVIKIEFYANSDVGE